MLFPYQCEKCGNKLDGDFPIGKAPRSMPCTCGANAKRVYSGVSIAVSVHGVSSGRKMTFGEEMKQRNASAGKRMKGHKPPVKLVGYDYGDGKVKEVTG